MKKIINGKRYDTDTAEIIGEHSYSHPGDFNYYCDQLYRKKTGEFFIFGEGGAASKYAVTIGQNQWSGGEKITPISFEEAQKWAEKNLDADDYEKVFGEVVEDDSKKTVAISLSVSSVLKLKKLAAEQGKPMSEIIDTLVKQL